MTTQPKFRPPCDQCRGKGCKACNNLGYTEESGRTPRAFNQCDIVTERVTVGIDIDAIECERQAMRNAMFWSLVLWVPIGLVVVPSLVVFIVWLCLKDMK